MAVPKSKISPSRRGKRRSSDKINSVAIILCSNCKGNKIAHHICKKCGYYRGNKYLRINTK